jgi:hypothetical protein
MSFPDLVQTPRGVLHSQNSGVPVNGVNEFDTGLDLVGPTGLQEVNLDDWLVIRVWALGTAVTNATYAGRNGNKIRVNFVQTGVDPCFVEFEVTHSGVR